MFIRCLYILFFTPLLAILPYTPIAASGPDGNWKQGRIYYRMVCTACHKEMAEKISPNSRTIAEWQAYLEADRHDVSGRSKASVKYYTSKAYRESVKDQNRAAAKLIDVPEQQLHNDVSAWLVRGAKDSDTPARCQ